MLFAALLPVGAPPAAHQHGHRGDHKEAWDGWFFDPNHPCCTRSVTVTQAGAITIESRDSPEAPQWRLTGSVEQASGTFVIDFTPRGGPRDLSATLSDNGDISFLDGNVWSRVPPAGRPAPAASTTAEPTPATAAAATPASASDKTNCATPLVPFEPGEECEERNVQLLTEWKSNYLAIECVRGRAVLTVSSHEAQHDHAHFPLHATGAALESLVSSGCRQIHDPAETRPCVLGLYVNRNATGGFEGHLKPKPLHGGAMPLKLDLKGVRAGSLFKDAPAQAAQACRYLEIMSALIID